MSRIGRQPVPFDSKVKVSEVEGVLTIEGPSGSLELALRPEVIVEIDTENRLIKVDARDDSKPTRSFHGLTRTLIHNMVLGVVEPYLKKLEISGVGYQAQVQGKKLVLQVGYCHPVELDIPDGITVTLSDPQHLSVSGPDKQKVGEFASQIRKSKDPDPYKAKGITYAGEQIRRKAGKAFVGGE